MNNPSRMNNLNLNIRRSKLSRIGEVSYAYLQKWTPQIKDVN
jgi:hypothetical protein